MVAGSILTGKRLALLIGLSAVGFGQDLILPQFALGGGWDTGIWLSNVGVGLASIDVKFMNDSGDPLFATANLGLSSSSSFDILPGATQLIFVSIADSFNLKSRLFQGWVKFTIKSGNVIGTGVLTQSTPRGLNEATIPLIPNTLMGNSQRLFYNNGGGHTTGIACVNVDIPNASAQVTLSVVDSFGKRVALDLITVISGHRIIGSVLDMYPETRGNAGFIGITTNGAPKLACFGLSFHESGGMTSILAQ